MNFSDLQAFIAVQTHGTVSSAAEALFLTQPAVSRRLRALEAAVGTALFDREGKRMQLTEAGEVLLPRAQALLAARDDATRAVHDLAAGVGGRLRLATSHHIGLHRLAPVLRAFSRDYPDVTLDIRFEDSEAAHELVANRTCDLAVVTLDPRAPESSDGRFAYEAIWHDPLVFVASPDHPLASVPRLQLADVAAHSAVMPGLSTYTGRIVADLFTASGLDLHQSMSTNYLETIGMLVAIGLGWSVLPRTMVTEELSILDVRGPDLARELGAVRLPQRSPSRAAQVFLEALRVFKASDG